MSSVPFGMSMGRARAVEFSSPIDTIRYGLLYKKQDEDTATWMKPLSLFSWQVYACGAVALIFTVLLFFAFRKYDKEKDRTFTDCMTICVHVPLHQGK